MKKTMDFLVDLQFILVCHVCIRLSYYLAERS